jgi:hypothetical protein
MLQLPGRISMARAVTGSERYTGNERTYHYTLGQRSIPLKVTVYGNRKDVVMISLHDDETTGVEAARAVLERTGGILLSIENNNQRIITFTQRGITYRFDPNRMFTRTGIKATLQEHSKQSTKSAINAIHGFSNFVLNQVPSAAVVLIALHNNDDAGFSALTYMKGGEYEKDAAAVHQSDTRDPDNFFLTTDKLFFREARSSGYNAILQHHKAKDDGSLSVLYGKKNRRYVNIEAETANVSEQKEMIETAVSFIREAKGRSRKAARR